MSDVRYKPTLVTSSVQVTSVQRVKRLSGMLAMHIYGK